MDNRIVLGPVPRPMHHDTVSRSIALELLQVIGESRERVHLDRRRRIAQLLPLGNARRLLISLESYEPQRLIVPVYPLIIENEERRLFGMSGHESRAPSNISATCITRTRVL